MHINISLFDRIIKRQGPRVLFLGAAVAIVSSKNSCKDESELGVGEIDSVSYCQTGRSMLGLRTLLDEGEIYSTHILEPFEKESRYLSILGFEIHLSGLKTSGSGYTLEFKLIEVASILTGTPAGMVQCLSVDESW